jgi:hypothetical protein
MSQIWKNMPGNQPRFSNRTSMPKSVMSHSELYPPSLQQILRMIMARGGAGDPSPPTVPKKTKKNKRTKKNSGKIYSKPKKNDIAFLFMKLYSKRSQPAIYYFNGIIDCTCSYGQ